MTKQYNQFCSRLVYATREHCRPVYNEGLKSVQAIQYFVKTSNYTLLNLHGKAYIFIIVQHSYLDY